MFRRYRAAVTLLLCAPSLAAHAFSAHALSAQALAGAPAQTRSCWDGEAVGAARIRELEILLMNVSLRCSRLGLEFREDYTRFRIRHEQAIAHADRKLLSHFGGSRDAKARSDYNAFLTRLANRYGIGRTETRTCVMFETVVNELASPAGTVDMLATIALDMIRDPQIDGPRCNPTARGSP